jgi:ubiquinone/menaquinone biosynthesis C-methylase UbiE
MGEFVNLINATVKYYDGAPRNMDPTFGHGYFDNTRDTGYGGYRYDGRWEAVAAAVVNRYGLKPGDHVLDLGCAKGFFLVDLIKAVPGIKVTGTDVSEYAVANAHPDAKPHLKVESADDLPGYADRSFDLVTAMNTLHFLTPERAEHALRGIGRIGKGRAFVQVDAFTNEVERERLLAWAPIIKTVYSVDQWLALFKKTGYQGDYWWTFVRPMSAQPAPVPAP